MRIYRICAVNCNDLQNIRIHDCQFTGFQFDYAQRTLFFKGWHVHERREISLAFHGVIDITMQACDFFGGGNSILCLYNGSDERLKQLLEHAERNPQFNREKLKRPEDILCVKMELNSGDELTILCKYLCAGERELQLSQLIMPHGQKSLWLSCAYALQRESDEVLLPHLAALFEWLKDMNWPGADLIAKRIAQIPKAQLLPAYEQAICCAQRERDEEWHENLCLFAQRINKTSGDEK